ncbi:uncharacterized protein LOC131023236 [Salvia miltiorrhiza]|uniref:uncharacterized protein LOC131023236 n=1 Tax=Salvia miltiorrhiza TaxID=226208 RepID=UPI0025AC7915|nr:uncharacterized protein LOC131023236 [Salvia miltiorrhiza]
MEKVLTLVNHSDGWKILSQLHGNPNDEDKPFWPYGKFNSFSVKSGYWLASDLKRRSEPSASNSSRDLWRWIWGLDVIPKIKFFMWKCLADALPTSSALRGRSIDIDPICRRCGECDEDMEHALRDCTWTQALWAVSPLRLQPIPIDDICTIPEWFERIRRLPQKESHAIFASLAWSSWYARNMLIFQGKMISHVECLQIAQRASWPKKICSPTNQMTPRKILCLRSGQLKISCDAAVVNDVGIGVEGVLQNGDGEIVGCRYGARRGVFSCLEGEALAVLEGLRLCTEKEVGDVIVETDSQILYWCLVKREPDLSYLGDTLDEIFRVMDSLHEVALSWTPREGNYIADRLASFALSNFSPFISQGSLPFVLNSSSTE